MNIEGDARAALRALLCGKVARYGLFHTTAFREIASERHYWLLKLVADGELQIPVSRQCHKEHPEELAAIGRILEVDMSSYIGLPSEHARLGPLAVAALRAHLASTTTTVVAKETTP